MTTSTLSRGGRTPTSYPSNTQRKRLHKWHKTKQRNHEKGFSFPRLFQLASSPTFEQVDISTKPEINFPFKCIRRESGHTPGHEEITSPSDHRNVPGFVHQRVCTCEVDATLMLRGVEHKGEAKPSRENLLLIVNVKPLGTSYGWWVQIVVQGDRVIEHNHVTKMVLPC